MPSFTFPDIGQLARVALAGDVARHAGPCVAPVHLSGSRLVVEAATGRVLRRFTSADLPGGVLTVRCGNRRASHCKPCSTLYKYDTYNLVAAGLRGGKDVPDVVGSHPRLFVTLTAPSFGPVHLGPDKHGTARPCHHRRRDGLSCGRWHRKDDPQVGTPLDPASYDYAGQVLFNATAGGLWSRFTIGLRRALAESAGLSRRAAASLVTVAFAKVAEFQIRGCVHFHAIVRVDGPDGPGSPAPLWATAALLADAVRLAARRAQLVTPDSPAASSRVLAWGTQIDIREITADPTSGRPLTDVAVAAYVAKYATKSAESTGATSGPIWCRTCDATGATTAGQPAVTRLCRGCHGTARRTLDATAAVSGHARALIDMCWKLGGLREFSQLRLRRWAHLLGFRGHFSTKSRTYSTTLGALRAERARYAAALEAERLGLHPGDLDREQETVLVINDWRYQGQHRVTPNDPGGPGEPVNPPAAADARISTGVLVGAAFGGEA